MSRCRIRSRSSRLPSPTRSTSSAQRSPLSETCSVRGQMATDVTMPRLSDSMEEGTILKWIVEEGGEVKRGEPLCAIETDKANMTYEADTDGTLIEIVVPEGETVALGKVIARIGEAGEEKQADDSAEEEEQPAEGEEEPEAEADEEPEQDKEAERER